MKKLAIVTGGSSGLGLCLSEELMKQEFELYIIGRNETKLLNAQKQLMRLATNNTVQYFVGDVSDETFVKQLFDKIGKQNLELKYLFNCAGEGQFGSAEENTRTQIDIAFSASLIGLILMSSNALKVMKDSGGIIVNIMSTAALKGNPNESIYCAAKWGARGFTEALKAATKGSKTKVVSVYPGGMNTAFWKPECGQMPDVSKFMNPSEVAEEIVNSVTDRTSMYVSELVIDRK